MPSIRCRLSMSFRNGRLPNELYWRIISYLDRDTNKACLTVSRAFRYYAMDTFFVDEDLTVICRGGNKPEYLHRSSGFRSQFRLTVAVDWPSFPFDVQPPHDREEWTLVLGRPDGSASLIPKIGIGIPPLLVVSYIHGAHIPL